MKLSQEEMNLINYIQNKVNEHCDGIHSNLLEDNIIRAYQHTFTSSKERIHYLTKDCILNQSSATKFMNGVGELSFGLFYDKKGMRATLKNTFNSDDNKKITDRLKAIIVTIGKAFESFLNVHRQRDKIALDYDMFADKTILVVEKHRIVRVSHHTPFKVSKLSEDDENRYSRVVADYLKHLPVIPELLKLGTASKFSTNARYAYVWMKLLSGGGKGYFINRLKALGIALSFSMEELEDVLRGKPSGKKQEDFDDLWFFIGDEVKFIKREMKELDSEINLSSKFGFEFSVKLPAKLLFSAEGIPTLTEGGVEDQFIERFSGLILETQTKLSERTVFKEVGNNVYEQCIERYFSITLNKHVQEYRGMGREEAQRQAYKDIEGFHNKYKIDLEFGSQKNEVLIIAQELKELFIGGKIEFKGREKTIKKEVVWRIGEETKGVKTRAFFVGNRDALNYINDYIVENYPCTYGKFIPKKDDILMAIDETLRSKKGVIKCSTDEEYFQKLMRGIIIYDNKQSKDKSKE